MTDAAIMANGDLSPPASDSHPSSKAHVDVNDPIYQAMMAAAKSRPATSSAAATSDISMTPPHTGLSPLQSPSHQGAAPAGRGGAAGAPAAKKARMLAAFGGEEEEDQPKRRLIPLQYRYASV